MPDALLPALAMALAGLGLIAIGLVTVRRSGAETRLGRRLAGAREVRVADVFDLDPLPTRPVRLVGRVRCPDPIRTGRDDRLVAFHRDVEARQPSGAWRTIERTRASRPMELWDHGGSLAMDLADAAEPLVTIPHVWEGDPAELDDSYRQALDRLSVDGTPTEARSVTRMVSVVDRLLVLARVSRDSAGAPRLEPPPGGYVVATVELDAAMRLLGGPRRRLLLGGAAVVALGALLLTGGAVWILVGAIAG